MAGQFSAHPPSRPRPPGQKRLSLRAGWREGRGGWAETAEGCCLLRTNLTGRSAEDLGKTYVALTEVEDSFRIAKHDLDLRPIFHHKADRTQARILVCFLALVLRRTLQHGMQASGLGTAPRKVLEEMAEVRSLDAVRSAGAQQPVRPRVVTRPDPHLAILLERLGLSLPNRPKRAANGVAKIAETIEKPRQIEPLSL
jgi:hypothetical protein